MVVYKSLHLYEGWCTGGIAGAQYDNTKSGWFDSRTFKKWFFEIFLKAVEGLDGTKVIIGENLGSHFSPEVIQATIDHNIKFITLPPNATHLCLPLDVAVFRSLKRDWRSILDSCRRETRCKGSIPKPKFPGLLARLMRTLDPQPFISGFKASGIFPMDRTEVLK